MRHRAAKRISLRGCLLLVSGFATMLVGCTFIPRGTAALRREAVHAGRPFSKSPERRRLPRLSAVPTPEELVRRALRNSPDVEAAYWQWRAAIEAVSERGTEATAPALGATVGLKNGAASTGGTMLQLANMGSAPIEWPSKPLVAARAALQRAYAAGWNYRRTQFAVRRQALDAWYKLVADSTMLRLLRRDKALVRELDEFARAAIEAGMAVPSAALRIENELTGLNARIAAVSAQLPADRAALNRIVGRAAERPLRVPGELPRISVPRGTRTRMLTLAVRRNPQLAALRRDIRAGRLEVERAEMNDIPDFSLSAAASLDGIAQNLGGAIMVPFVRYRAINAAIRQNRDWLRETEAHLRSRRLSIDARLVTDLAMAQSDARQISLYEHTVLPRLERLDEFGRVDVEQGRAGIGEPVRIERARIQVREILLDLRLDESERLVDLDTLTAARLTSGE